MDENVWTTIGLTVCVFGVLFGVVGGAAVILWLGGFDD